MALARIQVPEGLRRGELAEIRLIVQHPMETGFRREGGQRVPRNAIHSLTCKLDGEIVFRATLSAGIAANPYLRFFLRAERSGELELWWLDEEDVEGTAKARFAVT